MERKAAEERSTEVAAAPGRGVDNDSGPSAGGSKTAARAAPITPAEQRRRFEEAARKLGCDESEEAFDAALKAVAKHKLKPDAATPSADANEKQS